MNRHLSKKNLKVWNNYRGRLKIFRYFTILLFCFICTIFGRQLMAQSTPVPTTNTPKPLSIGDNIPDELWNLPLQVVNHPEGKKTITLADYKGKLIILDFWSTWCGACIAALPRLHELEKDFKDDIIILPITDQAANDINAFLKKNKLLSPLNLYSATDDKIYKRYFPYTMLPHEIWINKDRVVHAITHSSDVTKENILSALKGNTNSIQQKKDNLTYDRTLPLLLEDNGADEDFFLNRSIITPGIKGIPSFISQPKVNETNGTFRVSATNVSIKSIYSLAFKELRTLPRNQIKLEIDETVSISENRFLKDTYCYEWIAPISALKHLPQKIQTDLNYFFGINGRIEKRSTKCYAIKIIGKTTLISARPKDGLQHLSDWVYNVNKGIQKLPMVNDFDNQRIAIPKIPPIIEDIKAINKQLKPFGIAVMEEERILDLFVISEL